MRSAPCDGQCIPCHQCNSSGWRVFLAPFLDRDGTAILSESKVIGAFGGWDQRGCPCYLEIKWMRSLSVHGSVCGRALFVLLCWWWPCRSGSLGYGRVCRVAAVWMSPISSSCRVVSRSCLSSPQSFMNRDAQNRGSKGP